MKLLASFFAALAVSATAWSQQTVTVWRWNELPQAQLPRGSELVSFGGVTALKIENTKSSPLQLSLLTIPNPKISSQVFALKGEIRYEAVRGYGFLELWSYFPAAKPGLPEGRSFSRTRFDSSDMGKNSGTSDWRPFSVPFNSIGATTPPSRLQINLLLGGRGTVYLGPVKLVQYVAEDSYVERDLGQVWFYGRTAHPWWSNRACIWGSNVVTVLLLGFGLAIELLCGKGKRRELVVAMVKIHIGTGACCGIAALAALVQHQPFAVWFPLSLVAVILIAVYSVLLLTMDKYYRPTPG